MISWISYDLLMSRCKNIRLLVLKSGLHEPFYDGELEIWHASRPWAWLQFAAQNWSKEKPQ